MMSALTECYDWLTGWIRMESWLGVSSGFQDGFVAGVALSLVAALLLLALVHRIRHRTACKSVTVKGEQGDLVVTLNAVREFVKRILHDFGDTSLQALRLRHARSGLVMTVEVAVVPDTELVPLRDMLQERIIKDAAAQLGLSMPLRVNIQVRSLEADQAKIARKIRKRSGKEKKAADTGAVFEDYESGENFS